MFIQNNRYYKKYFLIYLGFLLFFAVFFLYTKHLVGNDSTISEWLINYYGGFTKRGIIGQIAIYFAEIFQFELRFSIYLLQTFSIGIYFVLIYKFFIDLPSERYFYLIIFTPIFLIHPFAEIEVLARKEIIVFILFLSHLLISTNKPNLHQYSKLITLTLSVLIWEPVVFFLPLWIIIDIEKQKLKKFDKKLIVELLCYLPALFISLLFIFFPITDVQHLKMATYLSNNFGETCYMSCALLNDKSTILQQFEGNYGKYSFEVLFRYFLILLIGFGPLLILLSNSKFKNKTILSAFSKNINPLNLFLISFSPVLLLFAMGYDWGRWVNISYAMFLFTFYYLFKNSLIEINFTKLRRGVLNKISFNKYVFIFIIFSFSWNQKTVITDDVASIPIYRVIYKFVKLYLF